MLGKQKSWVNKKVWQAKKFGKQNSLLNKNVRLKKSWVNKKFGKQKSLLNKKFR